LAFTVENLVNMQTTKAQEQDKDKAE
jgi:hypothetical protein